MRVTCAINVIACEKALMFEFQTQALLSDFSLWSASEFTNDARCGLPERTTCGGRGVSLSRPGPKSRTHNTRTMQLAMKAKVKDCNSQ